jgi:hypothetical protein
MQGSPALAYALGPNIDDEVGQLARDESSEPPLQRRSCRLPRNERPAAVPAPDDRGPRRYLAEQDVQSCDELARRRGAEDVSETVTRRPALTKGVLAERLLDSMCAQESLE